MDFSEIRITQHTICNHNHEIKKQNQITFTLSCFCIVYFIWSLYMIRNLNSENRWLSEELKTKQYLYNFKIDDTISNIDQFIKKNLSI